jgi:hypothetical protein
MYVNSTKHSIIYTTGSTGILVFLLTTIKSNRRTFTANQTSIMEEENNDKEFKPTGTIVFMILLLALTAAVWFSVYNLQTERHF